MRPPLCYAGLDPRVRTNTAHRTVDFSGAPERVRLQLDCAVSALGTGTAFRLRPAPAVPPPDPKPGAREPRRRRVGCRPSGGLGGGQECCSDRQRRGTGADAPGRTRELAARSSGSGSLRGKLRTHGRLRPHGATVPGPYPGAPPPADPAADQGGAGRGASDRHDPAAPEPGPRVVTDQDAAERAVHGNALGDGGHPRHRLGAGGRRRRPFDPDGVQRGGGLFQRFREGHRSGRTNRPWPRWARPPSS